MDVDRLGAEYLSACEVPDNVKIQITYFFGPAIGAVSVKQTPRQFFERSRQSSGIARQPLAGARQ